MQHPWGCSTPTARSSHRCGPMGCPVPKWDGNGAPMQHWPSTELLGRICPSSPHPSAPLPASPRSGPPPALGLRAGITPHLSCRTLSCWGERLPRRGRRFADLRLFSQLPRHILSGSHVCRSQALLSWLPAPGPVPGWKQHPDGAIFSHFGGGGEKGLGKSCRDQESRGKEQICKGGWLARPCFCGVLLGTGGPSGETEAWSTPARAASWLTVKSSTPAPSLCGCNWGDGLHLRSGSHLLSVGSSCPNGDSSVLRAEPKLGSRSSRGWRGRKSPSTPSILHCIHRKLSKPHYCVRG